MRRWTDADCAVAGLAAASVLASAVYFLVASHLPEWWMTAPGDDAVLAWLPPPTGTRIVGFVVLVVLGTGAALCSVAGAVFDHPTSGHADRGGGGGDTACDPPGQGNCRAEEGGFGLGDLDLPT